LEHQPLAGRVAIVSGAGRGLGRSFARHLTDLGAAVLVNGRQPAGGGICAADELVEELLTAGRDVAVEHSAAEDPVAGSAMVDAALSRWGRLDICVANAGVGVTGMFHRLSAESFDSVVDVNLMGAVRLARAAMPVMRAASFGRIVLISSVGGLVGEAGFTAYGASKGGMIGFGRSLAVEGQRRNVLTNMLLPYALTMMTMSQDPEQKLHASLSPDAVAPVVGALVSDRCSLNGQVIVSGAGMVRRVSIIEGPVVHLPNQPVLDPVELERLLDGAARDDDGEFAVATDSMVDLLAHLPPEPVARGDGSPVHQRT
jgi:NAD(P)-dependent dehydrogenase (short-subunit alcohol dehydrogenase family)